MKDRTEKESIDPLSSLTSALSKCKRDDTAFVRVDFAPLPESEWKIGSQKKIIETHLLPNFAKVFFLTYWKWIRVVLFPFVLMGKVLSLLIPRDTESHEHHTETGKE
jgi:hypothetical protein